MVGNYVTVKLYRRLGKKRYLKGKYTYEHERISLPIPSRFHDVIRSFLNQRLKIEIVSRGGGLIITLDPTKTFPHAESTTAKPRTNQ